MKIRDITRDFEETGLDIDRLFDTEDQLFDIEDNELRYRLFDRYRTAKDNAIGEKHDALKAQRAVLGTAWLLVLASSTARSHWPVASYCHLGRRASGSDPQHGGLWEPRAKNPLTAPWDNF